MAAAFDPYHKWLGISPDEQPPNHYRLLGLKVLEDDPDVIEAAADRQMTYLRTFGTGRHAELSQKILNEVAAARVCLLVPDKKAAYDRALEDEWSRQASPAPSPSAAPAIQPAVAAPIRAQAVRAVSSTPTAKAVSRDPDVTRISSVSSRRGRLRRRRSKPWGLILFTLAGFAAAGFAAYRLFEQRTASTSLAETRQTDEETTEESTADAKLDDEMSDDEAVDPNATKKLSKETRVEGLPPAKVITTRPGETIDLLSLAEVKRDGTGGEWRREGDRVISPANESDILESQDRSPRLHIPLYPSDNYRLTLGVTPRGSGGTIAFGFVINGHFAIAGIGPDQSFFRVEIPRSRLRGGEVVRDGSGLVADQLNIVVCTVSNGDVEIICNGRQAIAWRPSAGLLPKVQPAKLPYGMFVGSTGVEHDFHKAELEPLPDTLPSSRDSDERELKSSTRLTKLAVPGEEDRRRALELVKTTYVEEYKQAKTPEEKIELSGKLSRQAGETIDDPAACFVLYREAAEFAASAGKADAAIDAIGHLINAFDVDDVTLRVEMLPLAGKLARTPDDHWAAFHQAGKATDDAVAGDRHEEALVLADAALAAVRKLKEPVFQRMMMDVTDRIKKLRIAHDKIKPALETLLTNGDDPEANLAVGGYHCFGKRDFSRGLPMLAKGSDEKLKSIAARDMDAPAAAGEQVQLADDWWRWAESIPEFESPGKGRAAYWYALALPKLAPPDEKRVEVRLGRLLIGAGTRREHAALGYELKQHPGDAVEFEGHWYKFISVPLTWSDAQRYCRTLGGYLASPESDAERRFLSDLGRDARSISVGGFQTPDGRWMWLSGMPIDQFDERGSPGGRLTMEDGFLRTTPDERFSPPGFVCEWEF